jgi:putative tryptophan/tyrosine transport system substrate-binding protein
VITRRIFTSRLLGCVTAISRAAQVQAATKVWQIGYLTLTEVPRATFVAALGELGYVDGETAKLDVRSAEDNFERLPELAAALVRAKVDIIVAVSAPSIRAASQATRTTPVVMAPWGGPGLIESGIAASFHQPGGNVTGVVMLGEEMNLKRLEILLEAVPNARKVAILNPRGEFPNWPITEVGPAAQARKVKLYLTEVPGLAGYEPIFDAMTNERVDALLVPSSPRFFRDHQRIIEAAASRRIPAMYEWGEIARTGGFISYGPVLAELDRRAAEYVDRILKGTKPSDLPIEQPKRFDLVVNLKTAKALGVTVPQSLIARADEVIE